MGAMDAQCRGSSFNSRPKDRKRKKYDMGKKRGEESEACTARNLLVLRRDGKEKSSVEKEEA